MLTTSTASESPSKNFLDKVEGEFQKLDSRIKVLEEEKKTLQEKLKQAELEKNSLKPELLAKFHEDGKSLVEKEQALAARRKRAFEEVERAKAVYDAANKQAAAIDAEHRGLSDKSDTASALLYAKVDAYTVDLKKKIEAELERAKTERSKAETERQQADDLIKKAEENIKKIQDNGKSVLEKIAKAEADHEAKIKAFKEDNAKLEKERAKLERDISYLAELHEKRKKLESGVK